MLSSLYYLLATLYTAVHYAMSIPFNGLAIYGVVHTLSFEDAAQVTKKIGVFRKKKKPITNFTRI